MNTAYRLLAPGLVAPVLALGLGLSAAVTTTGAAYSAGGGDDVVVTPKCKKGFAWDRKVRKCVKAKKRSSLDDRDLLNTARELAYDRKYDEALVMLNLADNQNTPQMLNYRGFVTRKLGRVQEAMGYYQAALAIDPNYTLVREYMGEAFIQLGQIDKAREQLKEIAQRCGIGCREYAMLKSEIEKAVQ